MLVVPVVTIFQHHHFNIKFNHIVDKTGFAANGDEQQYFKSGYIRLYGPFWLHARRHFINMDHQLWNHWFGLKVGYKWVVKTIEFCFDGSKTLICTKNWIMIGCVLFTCNVSSSLNFFSYFDFPDTVWLAGWLSTLPKGQLDGSWFHHHGWWALLIVSIVIGGLRLLWTYAKWKSGIGEITFPWPNF